MIVKTLKCVRDGFNRAAKCLESTTYVHFDKAVGTMARERFRSAAENLRLESFHVDEENVRRSKPPRELIDADARHTDSAPLPRAIVHLSIEAIVNFDRVERIRDRSVYDLDVARVVQAAVAKADLVVVRVSLDRDNLTVGADETRQHHRDQGLKRSAIEHDGAGAETMLRQEGNLGRNFGRIAIVPAPGSRIRNPQLKLEPGPSPPDLVRLEMSQRPGVWLSTSTKPRSCSRCSPTG